MEEGRIKNETLIWKTIEVDHEQGYAVFFENESEIRIGKGVLFGNTRMCSSFGCVRMLYSRNNPRPELSHH